MIKLPGVGSKIALVTLHEGYSIVEGIAADSRLVKIFQTPQCCKEYCKIPAAITKQVQNILPFEKWGDMNMIYAGL